MLFCTIFWYRVRDWMIFYETRTYKEHTDWSSARPFIITDTSNNCSSCELHVLKCFKWTVLQNGRFPQTEMCISANAFFSSNANGNTYKSNHWIMRIKSNLQGGSPWQHLHDMHWWPLTLGNKAENNSELYQKVSCFPCNILFTVIFI